MAGFDNGTIQSGVFAQAKQFGSVLRGSGPPVPQAGVVGDLYLDALTWFLYNKRAADSVDPWGHYLFQVPAPYRATLKWFSAFAPSDDIGAPGDYCLLWAGWTNYGMQPAVYGPKQAGSWPENGNGPDVAIAAIGAGTVLPVGLSGEGAPVNDSNSRQLIAVGLLDEYVLAIPVTANAGEPVSQTGLRTGPASMTVAINDLYTAVDQHEV